MAQLLSLDALAGRPDAFLRKSPRGMCRTPPSQGSTAPSTPSDSERFFTPGEVDRLELPSPWRQVSMSSELSIKEVDEEDEDARMSDDACKDGPALTEDGLAIDLDGGSPIFFSCDSSSGQHEKLVMIRAAKAAKALEVSRAAAEVEAEATCSIDSAGVLRGESCLSSACEAKERAAAATTRLKMFQKKQRSRRATEKASSGIVLCADADGKVFVFLYVGKRLSLNRREKLREDLMETQPISSQTVLSIDLNGIARDCEMDTDVQ